MKIIDAITQVDNLKPNQYSVEEKINWLSEIELKIKNEIIDTHEKVSDKLDKFTQYTEDDVEKDLAVEEPYSVLYVRYLSMMVDYYNAEFTRYNNSSVMFNLAYNDYANYYNRKYKSIKRYKYKVF